MTDHPALRGSIAEVIRALEEGEVTSTDLVRSAVARHAALDARLGAYRTFDADGALAQAAAADRLRARARSGAAPRPHPLLGLPVSVKDIYGVEGLPTWAGSARRLPADPWSRDAWLVARLRAAGAVFTGKTHTVEFAYGGVGINPHGGTPWNPWDATMARIPGGSSCGAGVSLWEGSALLALGSDTGGSIRIPAAFTGVVGHKTTRGRLPTDGVVQLSSTFDTVGALTRTVEDAIWFFGTVDPKWGDPRLLVDALETTSLDGLRVGLPECTIWEACDSDVRSVLEGALEEIESGGAEIRRVVGTILDDAVDLYMTGGIGKAEIHHFLSTRLPGAIELLHPTVGARLVDPHDIEGADYRDAISRQRHLAALSHSVFDDLDILVLPTNLISPPPVEGLADDLERYGEINYATLRPTCPVNLLELCAVSIPVGLDPAGMPVGLQLVARGNEDEALLGVALAVERALGSAETRLGRPPRLADAES